MALSESDAKKRRDILKVAFNRINAAYESKKVFQRFEIFDITERGNTPVVNWTRAVLRRLRNEGYISLEGPTGFGTRPEYRALGRLEVTQDEISNYLATTGTGEPSLDERMRRQIVSQAVPATAAVADLSAEDAEDPEEDDQEAPETAPRTNGVPAVRSVPGNSDNPGVEEMLAALVGVLPQMVECLHRIEKHAAATHRMIEANHRMTERMYRDLVGERK